MKDGFVYKWYDSKEDKFYIGVHKGSINDGYMCSSKEVKKAIKERPNDFTRTIIAEGVYEDMRVLEKELLTSVNAAYNNKYYNKHNGNAKFYCKQHTNETKAKIGKGNKSRKRPDLTLKNLTDNPAKKYYVGRNMKCSANPMFGKKQTEESRQKMSKNRMGIGKDVHKSEAHKQALSEAAKKRWAKIKEISNVSN